MNGKKLYRNTENKMLAGVCSGIADYFDIDPTLVRLGWVLFSLLGGVTAMLVMIALRRCRRLSVYGVSVGGAAAHNIGQMAAACITLGSTMVLGYLPFLLAVSLVTGTLTGFVTALLMRATQHIQFR